jgi:hypothetical protein
MLETQLLKPSANIFVINLKTIVMTQAEHNQDEMLYRIVQGFFKKHEEFCNTIPALNYSREKILFNFKKIRASYGKVVHKIKHRDIKIRQRKELCEMAIIVSSGLFSHATFTKNKVLATSVNYCYSDFFRSVESTMLARCKQVLRTAQRTKNLSSVGLTKQLIENLAAEIKKYEECMQVKEISKAEVKKHNCIITKSLKECMNLMEFTLNPLMIVLKKTNYSETREYFNQCIVHKKAGRKKKRNKKQQSNTKTRIAKPNILHQKSTVNAMQRFVELATAEEAYASAFLLLKIRL